MNDTSPRDRPDVEFFRQIGAIDQSVSSRLGRTLPSGMTAAQFDALSYLCRRDGVAMPAELAKAAHVTKGAMTNTIQRLEAAGLVDVIADGVDRRRKLVTLTDRGAAAYDRGIAALRPHYADLRNAIPSHEFEAALPFLRKLRSWLDGNR